MLLLSVLWIGVGWVRLLVLLLRRLLSRCSRCGLSLVWLWVGGLLVRLVLVEISGLF